MSVLIDKDGLERRRRAAAGPLKPLAESLASDLEPLLGRELYFPSEKALLSRAGGRCEVDGTMLEFDPFSPHEHHCSRCGRVYTGELHDRFWNYWYQLWLAERAVHGAVLSSVGLGDRYAALAHDILAGYCERYLRYPNVDNVLGPTRLFFSTYLESIWLLQICVAADLMATRESALVDRVRAEIVEPSRSTHRRVRRRRVESPGLERGRASRRRSAPGRHRVGGASGAWPKWCGATNRTRHAERRNLVRRRELPSVRASRTLVRRDDGGAGGNRSRAGAHTEISARFLRAVPVGASGFHSSVPTRLPIRDLAAPMANRRALRAWPRATGRSDAARRACPHVPRRRTAADPYTAIDRLPTWSETHRRPR